MLQILQRVSKAREQDGFNGHPPLGVNATRQPLRWRGRAFQFQWAPTLGGECYWCASTARRAGGSCFNGHPPLGVNATADFLSEYLTSLLFQWAPTLGGECYLFQRVEYQLHTVNTFQWAPTLGGECYLRCTDRFQEPRFMRVSMGTHPWG